MSQVRKIRALCATSSNGPLPPPYPKKVGVHQLDGDFTVNEGGWVEGEEGHEGHQLDDVDHDVAQEGDA